jgi:hypothetical protein
VADVYADLCADGTFVTSSVGAGDPAVYFGTHRVGLPVEGNSVRAVSHADGRRMAIIAGQNDIAYLVDEAAGIVPLCPCYGRQSVAINAEYAVVVRSASEYQINGVVQPLPPDQQGTSIGIADIFPDDLVQWMAEHDAPREIFLGGVRLRYYVERRGFYFGLLLNGAEDQAVLVDTDGPHTLYRGIAHEPHLTIMDDGRIGASWRELGKAASSLIGPPWPPFHDASPPDPPDPPDPEPEEPVELQTTLSHLVTAFPDSDFNKPVQTRPAHTAGPWETVTVVKQTDGTYAVKNQRGDEWLSVQRDGSLQSRKTSDPSQPGAWERFDRKGNTLVERNKDQFGGFIPPGRAPVTFLVAGDL